MSRRNSKSDGWDAVIKCIGGLVMIAVIYFVGTEHLSSLTQ